MRILITCIIVLLITSLSYGQTYRYVQIKAKADSVLSSSIGWDLFQYCKISDGNSYYSYEKKKKEHFSKLGKRRIHKHVLSAVVSYHFVMPYPKCPCMDTISGNIAISLDTGLNVVGDIDQSFIPDLVTQHDSCHFITKQGAIEIALQQNLHTSVAAPYAYLSRQVSTHTTSAEVVLQVKEVYYAWVVLRTIWNEKSTGGNTHTTDDMVLINATTGAVIENKVIPYAPHSY